MPAKSRAEQSSIIHHNLPPVNILSLVHKAPRLVDILCQEHIKELSAVCKLLRQYAFGRTRIITIRDAREEALESVGKITMDAFPNLEMVFVVTEDPITYYLQSLSHSNWIVLEPREPGGDLFPSKPGTSVMPNAIQSEAGKWDALLASDNHCRWALHGESVAMLVSTWNPIGAFSTRFPSSGEVGFKGIWLSSWQPTGFSDRIYPMLEVHSRSTNDNLKDSASAACLLVLNKNMPMGISYFCDRPWDNLNKVNFTGTRLVHIFWGVMLTKLPYRLQEIHLSSTQLDAVAISAFRKH